MTARVLEDLRGFRGLAGFQRTCGVLEDLRGFRGLAGDGVWEGRGGEGSVRNDGVSCRRWGGATGGLRALRFLYNNNDNLMMLMSMIIRMSVVYWQQEDWRPLLKRGVPGLMELVRRTPLP